MKSPSEKDEEAVRKTNALMKDPVKWKEYSESRAERALKHWRKR